MPKPVISAGLLMFRRSRAGVEVFLVHPGGPFFKKKDAGAWSIPKGLVGDEASGKAAGETPLTAAQREFREETGFEIHEPLFDLGSIRQKSGKLVYAWAFEGDADPAQLRCNTFPLEWPPKSGRIQQFPEVDRGEWFPLPLAREKINPAQAAFLERLPLLLED